jgi:tetratricopeptide (TPR) repeat protein
MGLFGQKKKLLDMGDQLVSDKKFEEAIECYQKVLRKDKNNWRVYMGLGLAWDGLKKYPISRAAYELLMSTKTFKKVIDGDKNIKIGVLSAIANTYSAEKNYEKHLEIIEQILSIDPSNGNALIAKDQTTWMLKSEKALKDSSGSKFSDRSDES